MAGGDGEAKVVRGASLLILLQVLSRAATFVANQLLLRFMTASLLGVSTQLEVYYLSVLFFARESLRVAIQRQGPLAADPPHPPPPRGGARTPKQGDHDDNRQDASRAAAAAQETQAVVNLGYVAVALGPCVAALLGRMYLASVPAATLLSTPYLAPSVHAYALASALELLSEPAFVVMQVRLRFGARASAEGAATLARCAVTLAAAVWASRSGAELGVLPFALGQVAYGSGLLAAYALYGMALAREEGFSLLPRRMGRGRGYIMSYFYQPTLKLASSMMVQSFVKHILTQGDTFLVSILSTPTAQGVYALANNYGGLAARLVFQPVEESSRNYYSRLLSSDSEPKPSPQPTEKGTTKEEDGDDDDVGDSVQAGPQPSKAALAQASENLTTLLRFYTFASVPLLALGPTAAPLVLSLIAGPRWTASGAGKALAAYVYYIPLLAINGLAEAFVASVATEAQVHLQSAWMTAFSVLFGVSGYVFLSVLGWGAVGLVWANGINMAGRIAWALWFIRRYFAQRGARWDIMDLLPSPLAVLAAAVASQVVRRVVDSGSATAGVKAVLGELVKVAGTAVPFVGVLAFAERRFLIQCYQAVRGGRPDASKPQ